MEVRARNRVLGVLFVGVLMGALDVAIVGPALPALQANFGVNERVLSWVFSVYVLFNLLGTPLMAKLSDRAGRRAIYVLDVALFALGSLIVALSPSFWVLLVGRAVQGVGAGGIFPIASAVIGDTFPPDKRGGALGLIGAVFGLAFIIGPVLGGLLLKLSWHMLFFINLPIALGIIMAAWRFLPATRAQEPQPFDWAGLALLSLVLVSLSLGLNQLGGETFSLWPLLLLLLGMGGLSVFGAVESRAADPIFRFQMLRSRQLLFANALALGAGMGMLAVSFLPALLTAAFDGVDESTASFMLVPLVLAMMVGAPLAGRMLDRMGSKVVVVAGSSLLALALLLLALLPLSFVSFYSASLLLGVGLAALLGAPVRYIVINAAPVADRAAAQGGISVVTGVGQLFSAAMMGSIAASVGGGAAGYQAGYLVIGFIAVGMVGIALRLQSRADEQQTLTHHEHLADAPDASTATPAPQHQPPQHPAGHQSDL